MAGGNVVTLTECKRSEAQLYDFYASLIPGGSRHELPLADCLRAAKEQFHYDGPCRWNLVISHQKRKRINKELNLRHKPEGAVWLEVKAKSTGANAAQSMFLWPGLQLFGCLAGEKKGVRNQCLYTVKELGEDTATFEELDGAAFTHEQVRQWFRLSYAQTYASCQGTEFDGPLRLWDTTNAHFTRRHLFVALSRAKQAAFVDVRP